MERSGTERNTTKGRYVPTASIDSTGSSSSDGAATGGNGHEMGRGTGGNNGQHGDAWRK